MSDTHTHWKKAFNKDYLGSHDLEPGEELKVTIKNVTVMQIVDPKGDKSPRNVAHFSSNTKPMILNATACKQLKGFTGSPYIEDWQNVSIQIYVQEVKAFGEVVDALRIRAKQPQMEKPVLTPQHPKWKDACKAWQDAEDKDAKLKQMRKHYDVSDQMVEQLNVHVS